MKKALIRTSIIVITMAFLIGSFLNYNYQQERETIKQATYSEFRHSYQAILAQYQKFSDFLFIHFIDIPYVQKTFDTLENKDTHDDIRKHLLEYLNSTYAYLNTLGIRQVHFHLKNNHSFLRFHRPEKYGDDLSGVRKSVVKVNKTKKFTQGFEEGRIFNGIRYIYPLNNSKNEHIGSVEISISMYYIQQLIQSTFKQKVSFIIKKDIVDSKVFSSESDNYEPVVLSPDFYIDKKILIEHMGFQKLTKDELLIIQEKLKEDKGFVEVFEIGGVPRMFTFLPIINFENKVSGYLISSKDVKALSQHTKRYMDISFGAALFLLVLSFLLYKNMQDRESLYQSTKEHKKAQEVGNIGHWLIELPSRKIHCSEQIYKMFGFDENEKLDLEAFYELMHPEDAQNVETVFEDFLKDKESKYEMTYRIFHKKTKEIRYIHEIFYNIKDENDNLIKSIGISQDVTTIQRLEEHNARKNRLLLSHTKDKAMREIISMIAHQWRQPLQVISMQTNNILLDLQFKELDEDKLSSELEEINAQILSLSKVIQKVEENNETNYKKEKTNILEVMRTSIDVMKGFDDFEKIDLNLHVKDDFSINSYPVLLLETFIIILSNSYEAMQKKNVLDKGKLDITIKKDKDMAFIEVLDNAGGIDTEDLPRIFEPYFTTKKELNGSGLGLYIAKCSMNDYLHGDIKIENKQDGVEVRFELPII